MLPGTKASPGSAELVAIPAQKCPQALQAIGNWIVQAQIRPGEPIVRPLLKGGIARQERVHAASIGCIVKAAMLRHYLRLGVPAETAAEKAGRFTGHSGRVGMYVTASEAGSAPQHTAAIARHKSLGMVLRYSKRADMVKCAPHHLPGVGV